MKDRTFERLRSAMIAEIPRYWKASSVASFLSAFAVAVLPALADVARTSKPQVSVASKSEYQSVEKQSESAAQALKANASNESALNLLKKNLKSPVAYDRAAAVVAARVAGRNARALVPLLIAALKDESTNVRGESATTLGAIGPDAKAAVPALKEAASSAHPPEQGAGCCMVQRDLWVHAAAEKALKLIGEK